jgi:hypothetical protein
MVSYIRLSLKPTSEIVVTIAGAFDVCCSAVDDGAGEDCCAAAGYCCWILLAGCPSLCSNGGITGSEAGGLPSSSLIGDGGDLIPEGGGIPLMSTRWEIMAAWGVLNVLPAAEEELMAAPALLQWRVGAREAAMAATADLAAGSETSASHGCFSKRVAFGRSFGIRLKHCVETSVTEVQLEGSDQ